MNALPSAEAAAVQLRSPDVVMRLARMGAAHQTRLSFLRSMLRRAVTDGWRFSRPRFDIDHRGVGVALYRVEISGRSYTLVAFGHDLPADQRTDRVIAEAWDATFTLYDGVPGAAEIARLAANVPLQEAGRCQASELILARANRSVRLFDRVVAALAAGRQPDAAEVEATGYLMRTTAVYGNGKFGIADRAALIDRPELAHPFRVEMLTVYLIRAFTLDLVDHMASCAAPQTAVRLEPELRRRFGIGNATGLGMAPFIMRHPALIDRWVAARETALARARAVATAAPDERRKFAHALAGARGQIAAWKTDDVVQAPRIAALDRDLARLAAQIDAQAFDRPFPWDGLYRFAETELSLEGQEITVALLIEPHGAIIDELAESMGLDESAEFTIDGRGKVGQLRDIVDTCYAWAGEIELAAPESSARFWYVSEEKFEPRLGFRHEEPGAERELPLAVAQDIRLLARDLATAPAEDSVAVFLLRHPEHRHVVRRMAIAARYPYAEVRDNLIGNDLRAIDLLRCKLAFFGATRFDPRSDKWLRITLFQGAPFPDELHTRDWDGWIWDHGVAAAEGARS